MAVDLDGSDDGGVPVTRDAAAARRWRVFETYDNESKIAPVKLTYQGTRQSLCLKSKSSPNALYGGGTVPH
jgi:hypothetical protein